MYKYLVILVILIFSNCSKQVQYITEEKGQDIISIEKEQNVASIMEEKSSQEDVIRPDFVSISNEENFPLENIIGAWWQGTPTLLIEIKFANDGFLYIKELGEYTNILVEDFFPYRIEGNNIIIENTNRKNNLSDYTNDYFLVSGKYIYRLDTRELSFHDIASKYGGLRRSYSFYKGTMEEVLERSNIRANYENKLKEFVFNEILNGIVFQGDENDENGVINTYGVPIKDEIIEYSDGQRYEGGRYLLGIREITYEDLIHRYYVFNRDQWYLDVVINKKLDRLIMINIGASSEDVIAVFGNNYQYKDGEDIIYMLGGDDSPEPLRWVRFSIENNIVIKISYIITSWL